MSDCGERADEMRWLVGRSTLGSHRTWVGGTAAADLVARFPADVLAPAVSLVGGYVGTDAVGTVTTWLLFGVVFYTFAPLIYELADPIPAEESVGFRLLFAGSAVAMGLVVTAPASTGELLTRGLVAFWVIAGAMVWFLSRGRGWDLSDPNGPALEVLHVFAAHESRADLAAEIETDLKREGVLGAVGRGLYVAAFGVLVAFPVFLAGVLSQVFVYAYPLPDLLFLGWALAATASRRVPVGPSEQRVLELGFDLEAYLLDAVENASRSVQGLFMTSFVVLGTFQSAGTLFLALATLPLSVEAVTAAVEGPLGERSLSTWLLVWDLVGVTALLFLAGGFALWAWIREFQRLPHFLDRWERRTTTDGHPLGRPAGFLAVPVLALLAVGGYLFALGSGAAVPDEALFAVAWPGLVALGVAAVRRTGGGGLRYENWVITGGLSVQFATLSVVVELLAAATEGRSPSATAAALPLWVGAVVCSVAVLPVVNRYEERRDGRRYVFPAYLCTLGAVALAIRPLAPAGIGVTSVAVAAVAFCGGVLLALVRWRGL